MTPKWTVRRLPRPDAALRLYAFPHSGGSPGEFVRWADELPDVEVLGVQLPGHGSRFAEEPLTSMAELVAAVVEHVDFRPPFAFFGHSLGALVAHEVALELRERGRPLPDLLVVSAIPAPHHGPRREAVHHLPEEELISFIDGSYGGGMAQVAGDRDLLAMVLPAYRADFEVYETYRYSPRPPLDVPLRVFGGRDDDIAEDRLADWARHTTAGCELTVLPGGHFYLRDAPGREEVLSFLRTSASRAATR
ncbi:alpha/beta fold hydrolase [Saccharothrix sp. BKS2]|uniref:thioesterase II family protein n=1 Tax=Saccharothrix sp. BKS2 TaxID=3064400 RepID=UPI0039EA5798